MRHGTLASLAEVTYCPNTPVVYGEWLVGRTEVLSRYEKHTSSVEDGEALS
jgi:hypothetical protein